MLNLRKWSLGFLASVLAVGLLVGDAEAQRARPTGFITNRYAAQRVSRLPGVVKARSVGRTPRYVKVTSEENGSQSRLRYVNKRTGVISSTSGDLVPEAKQAVALFEGRGGKAGGSKWKDYAFTVIAGDATGRGLPLLTDSGKNLRIGLLNSGPEGSSRNRLVSILSGRAGAIMDDPADAVRSNQ